MKKILIFFSLLVSVQVTAQTYPITSITISLPINPDANTANWGSGTSLFTITANSKAVNGRVDGHVTESKILVTIKKGGAKVCGSFTANTAPASNFNTLTKVWSGTNAVSLLGQSCAMPAGEYELTVQFFGTGAAGLSPLSEEKIKPFSIIAKEQLSYQPPQAIAPANGTVLSEMDIKKPITFRWTPVIPRPQEPITYRLKVWQLMQGQNGAQAMATNQPIITKDVDNLTQTIIPNLISGPCLAPYLCDYIWNVQALNREGKPVGGNNGTSEALNFNVQTVNDAPTKIALVLPANGSTISANDKPKFTWKHEKQNTESSNTYKIKIVEIIGDQSPEEALRTNKPHFEKDSLKEISFQYPSSAPSFIAGKKYGWNVQVKGRDGKSVGANDGMSEAWVFSVQVAALRINNFIVSCGAVYGSYTYTLTAENIGNNPINTTSITFTSPGGGSITGATFTPPSSNTVINLGPGNAVTFTGGFNYTGIYPAVVNTIVSGTQLGNTGLNASSSTDYTIEACICHDCDKAIFSFTPSGITPGANSNQINLAGNISVSGLPAVYGLEIQVQSYNNSASPSTCSNGVTGIEQSGVFLMPSTSINGITSIQMFNETASGSSNNNASKTIKLVSTTAFPGSIPVNLTIGLPGPLAGLDKDCCKMEYNLCIKIKVFHDREACKSCVFTYCFPSFHNQ